ncbi:hypothetical protein Nepgr_023559 [Nepenthes gracilis]|uniref:RING-type E3 ubiquitin transferase n=1 Tax=Nepenthes gracilis TaxID=150966 RepID=A0AAD3XXT9_NEPGR|nr:hypothetical protein Nepgr_023559 [Nepenthes gracilis]
MGGCCSSSRKSHFQGTPVYYYCPPALEEQETLRSYLGAASGLSAGRILVELNLDTSSPDTYRPPPAPIPFNVLFGHPQTPSGTLRSPSSKHNLEGELTESGPIRETAIAGDHGISTSPDHIKKSDRKTLADILLSSPTKSGFEPSNPNEHCKLEGEEDDVCPICLEEYDSENPKMITNCEHDFHLSCVLDWMERSSSCPVCDQEVTFNPPVD